MANSQLADHVTERLHILIAKNEQNRWCCGWDPSLCSEFLNMSLSHHLLHNTQAKSYADALKSLLTFWLNTAWEGRWKLELTGEDCHVHQVVPLMLHCPWYKTLTLSTVTLTISNSKAAASAHNPVLRTFSVMWCCKSHCNIESRSPYNRKIHFKKRL